MIWGVLLVVMAVAVLGSARAASSPQPVWTAIGPYGAAVVNTLVPDPSNPGTLYAATTSGVWKTTDGAQTWTWASNGLANLFVNTIAIDPANPARLLVGTDGADYQSVDGGATWTPIEIASGTYEDATVIAFAPSHPTTIYAGDVNGLYRSTDSGQHWVHVYGAEIGPVVVDPGNANVVYVSTPDALVKTVDGGATWHSLPTDHPWVASIVIDPAHPQTVYLGDGAVTKSIDGGATWAVLNTPAGIDVFNLALSPSTPATLYAVGRQGLTFAALKSTDGGGTWHVIGGVPNGSFSGQAAAVDPSDSNTFYVSVLYRGVFRSTDGGATFADANQGLAAEPAWAITFAPNDPNTVYASIGESGLFRSGDGGQNWGRIGAGLDVPGFPASISSLSTSADGTLYAARNFDGYPHASLVMKSADQGEHWTDAGHGLPDYLVSAGTVYADPLHPGTVFIFLNDLPGTSLNPPGGALYRTINGGDSWAPVSPTHDPVQAVAFNPKLGTIVLASGTLQVDGEGVTLYESDDWGDTWRALAYPGFETGALALGLQPGVIYAAGPNLVARSDDGGNTWSPAGQLLATVALAVDPVDPSLVYAAGGQGFWYSEDRGAHWTHIGPLVNGAAARALAFPPQPSSSMRASGQISDADLYGGVVGAGVARIVPAPHAMALPHVSGRLRVGLTLTCRVGSWSRVSSFRYSWYRGHTRLVRHKAARYRVVRRDRHRYLHCVVAATGRGGSASASSRSVRIR
jgi:photosystem II stability/assembly factor-like uncharacterized protein